MTWLAFDVWEHGKPYERREKNVEAHSEEHAAEIVAADLVAADLDYAGVAPERFLWVVAHGKPESQARMLRITAETKVVYAVGEAHPHACADCKAVMGCSCWDAASEQRCEECASKRRYREAKTSQEVCRD